MTARNQITSGGIAPSKGNFTPSIGDDSLDGSGESQTYDIQLGRYTKIGDMVFIYGRVGINSLGTLTTTEQVRIMGLPFTSQNTANLSAPIHIGRALSLAMPSPSESLSGDIDENTAYIKMRIWELTTGNSIFLISELTAGGEISFGGFYKV